MNIKGINIQWDKPQRDTKSKAEMTTYKPKSVHFALTPPKDHQTQTLISDLHQRPISKQRASSPSIKYLHAGTIHIKMSTAGNKINRPRRIAFLHSPMSGVISLIYDSATIKTQTSIPRLAKQTTQQGIAR